MTLFGLFLLLVVYQIKHLVADYFLQGKYMLGKFKEHGWGQPLTAHVSVHAVFTFIICLSFGVSLLYSVALAALDFVVHFVVDRIKASPNLLGRWKPTEKQFWWALGVDQMMHHLTHYVIIFAILSHLS